MPGLFLTARVDFGRKRIILFFERPVLVRSYFHSTSPESVLLLTSVLGVLRSQKFLWFFFSFVTTAAIWICTASVYNSLLLVFCGTNFLDHSPL